MKAFLYLFEQRVRGIRLIELIGLALALGMIFAVCLSKTREGEDVQRLKQLDQQISDETDAVSTLKVKVAQLERPARLEALATTYLGMKPVESTHETRLDSLSEISRTISRPMAVSPQGAAALPEAPAVPTPGDDLISVSAGKTATPPAAAPVSVYAPPAKTGGHQ